MSVRKPFGLALTFVCLQLLCAGALAQTGSREKVAAEIESLREQIRVREAALLAVPDEDRKAHADFLAQPDTGLVRLLPREKWDGKLSTRGGGSYYSFTLRSNEYGRATDIGLAQGNFQVGFAGADFGFITDLGDVPLENVSTATEAVQFMAAFEPPAAEGEARKAGRQFYPARREGTSDYVRMLPAAAGKTYALRSIVYDDADVLVAFRVLRKDADDSVVLLWKVLKKYPKPALIRDAAGS